MKTQSYKLPLFLLITLRISTFIHYLPYHHDVTHYELITEYTILYRFMYFLMYAIADYLTSYILNSQTYLIISTFLPPSKTSLENLLCSLIGHNWLYDYILYYLLCNFSIFYYPLSLQFIIDSLFIYFKEPTYVDKSYNSLYSGYFKDSLLSILIKTKKFPILEHIFTVKNNLMIEYNKAYSKCHEPSLNITWFFFLHIFVQYSHMFFHYFYFVFWFLVKSVKGKLKLEMICLFGPSTFKHWLLHICKDEDFIVYFSLFVLYKYVEYLLFIEGLANPNFLNWISFVFVSFFLIKKYIQKKYIIYKQ